MKALVALLSGVLFGAGLMVAGLFDPKVIVGALDVFGVWDPTLYIALASSSSTYALVRVAVRRWNAPFAAGTFHEPSARHVDTKLVVGASLFGASWGFAGFCPGLALVNLGAGGSQASTYLLAAVVGMAVAESAYEWIRKPRGGGRILVRVENIGDSASV